MRRVPFVPRAGVRWSSVVCVDALAGPFLAAAVLLVAAGGSKLVDPLPLVRALRSARLPAPAGAVRAFAGAEVVLGLVALTTGSRAASAGVALSYAAFTGFVLLARHRGGVLASCGCFGKTDTPPTSTHVVVSTAALAGVAGVVAVRPLGPVPDLLAGSPLGGLALVVATVAVAATAYLVLAVLPLVRA